MEQPKSCKDVRAFPLYNSKLNIRLTKTEWRYKSMNTVQHPDHHRVERRSSRRCGSYLHIGSGCNKPILSSIVQ